MDIQTLEHQITALGRKADFMAAAGANDTDIEAVYFEMAELDYQIMEAQGAFPSPHDDDFDYSDMALGHYPAETLVPSHV